MEAVMTLKLGLASQLQPILQSHGMQHVDAGGHEARSVEPEKPQNPSTHQRYPALDGIN